MSAQPYSAFTASAMWMLAVACWIVATEPVATYQSPMAPARYSSAELRIAFDYPQGWTTMSPDEVVQKTMGLMKPTAKAILFLVNDRDPDRNVNVRGETVAQQSLTDTDVRQLEAMLDKTYPKTFQGFSKVSTRTITVAGARAFEYVMDVSRVDKPMRQKVVLVVRQGRSVTLTFTAPRERYAAADSSCFQLLQESLSLGGGAEARGAVTGQNTPSGAEALIGAADRGDTTQIAALLSNGVSIDSVWGPRRITAVIAAAQKGHIEAVRTLIAARASADSTTTDGTTGLIQAAQAGHTDVVTLLIEAGAMVNAKRYDGATALIGAAQNGHTDAVLELLRGNADVAAVTQYGVTALLAASLYGHAAVVQALIKAGADVNVRDRRFGATPLIMASQRGHLEVVRALIDAHADVAVRMNNGQSALDFATSQRHGNVAKLLRAAGAK
jgi:uncharacterized protein